MKTIELEHEDEHVRQFILSIRHETNGLIFSLKGAPIRKVVPVTVENRPVDEELLIKAILNRRDASRSLNQEWENADRDVWEATPSTGD